MKIHHLILSLLSLLLVACQEQAHTSRPIVTVTIEPLRFFTEQIADTLVQVQSIVPTGSSPETYEPTPRQMVELANSVLYIKVGQIGFETTWMDKLRANAPKMKIVDSSAGIQYIESSDGIKDPHTWMSCTNARIISRNICRALTEQDPANKAIYEKNLQRLLASIDSTDRQIRQTLAHSTQRSFIIYHPALTYFAHDYQLLQLPMEEEGREPNAASLQHLIQKAQETGTRTIFVQQEFSPRNVVAIRKSVQAIEKNIQPLEYHWMAEMLHIADALK